MEQLDAKNIWLGVTAENQQQVDERVPLLRETPAAIRFLTIENMRAPINLRPYLRPSWSKIVDENGLVDLLPPLDGVIVCIESDISRGHELLKSIRDQCAAVGVQLVTIAQVNSNGEPATSYY